MKVLSLFDGMSCVRVALERAGIDIYKYYASEIDKYALQVSADNYPDNYTKSASDTQGCKMLGNVWTVDVLSHIFKGIK